MRLLTSVLALCVVSSVSLAQSFDDFDEIGADIDKEFEAQTQRIDDIYNAVDEAIDRAYKGLTKKIEVKWPDGALPERHKWVTYNNTMTSRAIADYETGELVIETIIEDKDNAADKVQELVDMSKDILTSSTNELDAKDVLAKTIDEEVSKVVDTPLDKPKKKLNQQAELEQLVEPVTEVKIQALQAAVKQLPKQIAATPEDIKSVIEQVDAVTLPPTTDTQVVQPKAQQAVAEEEQPIAQQDKPEPQNNVEQVAETSVKPTQTDKQAVTHSDDAANVVAKTTGGKQVKALEKADSLKEPEKNVMPVLDVVEEDGVTKLQLRIAFVNNYQEKLVSQYFDEIKSYANKYDVPVSVIMAIIETESSYNPRAVSPIPAFGLMQLVPKTAGLDAHLFVYGEKKVVSADYLFNEENNLRLGSAYFHLLTHRYLRKIKDPEARFYCAVASYNTGVGNLARTFTGKKSINGAVAKINQLDSQAVYDYLLANLPADETKNYLRKVVKRMQKYKQFDA